jgi:hypothetical protein
MKRGITVVYLARAAEGLEPLRAFSESYRRHPAGTEHELCVIYKGFTRRRDLRGAREALDGIEDRSVDFEDVGLDIGAYLRAARTSERELFCGLNTFSTILHDGWLGRLAEELDRPGVGLTGASASYESFGTSSAFHRRVTAAMARGAPGLSEPYAYMNASSSSPLRERIHGLALRALFRSFPHPHVRSNAFLVDRRRLLRARPGRIDRKTLALLFESGRWWGLSRRVHTEGLSLRLVGREGGFDVREWPESRVFRLGDQENLLVADNQTRVYAQASEVMRCGLRLHTWGEYLDPRLIAAPSLGRRFRARPGRTGGRGAYGKS